MKSLKYLLSVFLISAYSFMGCNEALNVQPENKISENVVWNDPNLIESYLNNIYRGMDHGANQAQLASMTDQASSIPDLGTGIVLKSEVTPGNMGNLASSRSDQYKWGPLYSRIHQTNVFLKNIQDANIDDQALKDRMTGEAHFLRAYFYHNLLRAYGGVPIVTEVYGLNDNKQDPRASFKETVDFIISEADKAAQLLPTVETGDNLGRASAGAAMALKSRVLLFAASDLYNTNPSGMPETGYTTQQDRTQLWRDAKNVAKAVMDLGVYHLFRANPAPGDSVAKNYYDLFFTQHNPEVIMERDFSATGRSLNSNYRPHIYHGPNGYHQWGGSTPTQQLVDAYKMKDGSDFSWNDPQEAAHPYENRDPRFYATILYDGAPYRQRPADDIQWDHDGVIQTFKRLTLPDGSEVPGLDTRDSPVEPWNGTWSGYYPRKILDDKALPSEGQVPGMWIYFRYGEVLLNYAEASIELGEYADARSALNKIRDRVNMPEFNSSVTGQALMDAYRNERRIELAYEEHRFFDIRRWMIAPQVMNEDAKGITITADATDRADRSTYSNYQYTLMTYQDRLWKDKMYFFPIPQDEMNRNEKLVQNPGY